MVAGTPGTGDEWIASGGGLGGGHPLYQVLSIIVATFLGTMGLPHVLVRFYTNPDGRAARRTALAVVALLSVFYFFPILLGVFSRLYVPQLLITGTADAAVLLAPGAAVGGIGGQLLAALVAAGAIAAFLATSSGLLISVAGAWPPMCCAVGCATSGSPQWSADWSRSPCRCWCPGLSCRAASDWPLPSRRPRCARYWCSGSGGAA
ncbi:putative symporter [Mycolicibacterium conceptionense]|uniref:Putative symporter n=1 Tax=Mycolicibacterium conceptionense TaxID=451644 RepID=A0A0U1DJQ3_9MYCO|nr:putative symporter [Mycolicibacterium conceptionense]